MSKRIVPMTIVAALVLVAMLFGSISMATQPTALGAPLAGPTPVSVTRPSSGEKAAYITFTPFNATALTADTTVCQDIGNFSVADVLYVIDQGTTNTTTLTAKWGVGDTTNLATGVNVVATNTADATDMQQIQLFGRYLCLLADVTNANAVTVTAQVIAR